MRKRCYNCIHAGTPFKLVDNKTHMHCEHPKWEHRFEEGTACPWDTLREFWSWCPDFEYKITEEEI